MSARAGLLHTVIFNRALGPVRPREVDLQLFDLTYVRRLCKSASSSAGICKSREGVAPAGWPLNVHPNCMWRAKTRSWHMHLLCGPGSVSKPQSHQRRRLVSSWPRNLSTDALTSAFKRAFEALGGGSCSAFMASCAHSCAACLLVNNTKQSPC